MAPATGASPTRRPAQGLGGGKRQQLDKFPGTGLRPGRAGDQVCLLGQYTEQWEKRALESA